MRSNKIFKFKGEQQRHRESECYTQYVQGKEKKLVRKFTYNDDIYSFSIKILSIYYVKIQIMMIYSIL